MSSEAPPKDQSDVAAEQQPSAPKDDKARLQNLVTLASAKHASRDLEAAADLFSQATELQTKLNGEMSPENADLLFSYGRCLFQLAVRNSDVLGSKVPIQQNPPSLGEQNAEGASLEAVAKGMAEKTGQKIEETTEDENKSNPLFSFAGDETVDDDEDEKEEGNDDDEGEEDGEQGQGEEEDDFANAFEALDLARILLLKKLDHTSKADDSDPQKIHDIKVRLADTHSLQAEISLEGENFTQAVSDYTDALKLTQELFPPENARVAEGHYMLALALEMCPDASEKGDKDKDSADRPDDKTATTEQEHGNTLEQARHHMRLAIDSCKGRIASEKQRLAETKEEALREKLSKGISEVEDIVSEMQQRVGSFFSCPYPRAMYPRMVLTIVNCIYQLHDMRKPSPSINDAAGAAAIEGLLGQMLGQPSPDQEKRLEEARKGAKDVSGLVKKRKKEGSDEKATEQDPEKKPRT